ncbi:hypothetical protein FS749_007830 [Ceratobasidium sp. UAMH 11750]|nr:hypothetical protein FS749_007830 [Ceratobasidium sp. UAMH 11750]
MEARRSFVSSRFFANDQRPVPNIVAIYERPRHKIRRDATHVLGGMFGWNSPEETERALRAESSRTEEATATPESATPVDPAPAGPSQRCTTKPAKRAKRRGFAPLIDMGASILSLHFQELLRRQHQPEEEDLTPVSAPAKRPIESTADISTPSTVTASASKKARISVSAGDAPIAKKLRLTISIPPPNDVPLSTTLPPSLPQLPLSPPDTSSNASKAPAEESAPGLASAWTPMDPLPLLPDFDATLPLDPLDSSSSSSSSSESSSDLDSDSPDLSSSSSTRSDAQTKGKGKANTTQKAALVRKNSKSASPFPTPVPARGPSTPPRKKRPTHKPGWIGWVQTEESPDHSRLIRLDDAPVILGRRTRSGREFHDPPPPPPSRRKPANGGQPKPDQTPRPRPKPTRRGKKSEAPTGEKSQQQNALQEARKLVASGESEEVGGAAPETQEGEAGGDEPKKQATENLANGKRASEPADGEPPVVSPSERPSGPASTSVPVPPASVLEPSQEANTSSPQKRSQIGSTSFTPPTSDTSPVAPFAPVLKLTRSDAVITPTAGRPDDPSEKEHNKKDTPTNQKKSGAPIKAVSTKSLANATDDREPPSQASPSLAKATSDVSAPSKKTLAAAKNDQPKNMYIALKKSRSSTSASTSKPLVISKVGSSQRRSGWGSDTSAGETSPVVLHVPRIASPSPPEKAKRPAPVASTGNPAQSTSSSTRVPTVTSTKSGDTPASASSVKPTVATTDRQLYFSKFGKSIHVGNGASTLGKRKEPVAQASSAHFKKRKLSRKLVVSSSDESDGARPTPPTFFPNPFERRAKQMELTRKGVSGDAFRHEMDKWMDMKRAEWKAREKPKANGRDSEKSGSDGKATGNAPRPSKTAELGSGAVTDNAASKFPKDTQKGPKEPIPITRDLPRIHMVNDLPRIPRKNSTHSDHAGNSPKIQKASSKRVWNGDWGMDVHQVSVTVSGDVKNKFKKFQYRRESDGATTDRRDGDQGERRVKDHSSTQDPTNTGVAPWGARA